MPKKLVAGLAAFALLATALTASAATPNIKAKPWVYDPDNLNVSESRWVTKEGLPDAGRSAHALYLTKEAPTASNTASGASIDFEGVLTELGFDYRNDGHCGAGAPRFNVYTDTGTYYFFGCASGIHTPAPDDPANWTRVRFTDADAFPADGVTAFPGFGSTTVTGIEIVFDEGTDVGPGFVYLDNIDVNGVIMGKPGNGKVSL